MLLLGQRSVGCLYRPPDCDEPANASISQSFRAATSLVRLGTFSDLVICGDFNFPRISWDSNGLGSCVIKNGQDSVFTETVGFCGLHQHVKEPTFLFDGKPTTLIDLVFNSRHSLIFSLDTSSPLGSSLTRCLLSILFDLTSGKPAHAPYSSAKYRFRSGDYERMNRSLLNSYLTRRLSEAPGIDDCYRVLTNAYDDHCANLPLPYHHSPKAAKRRNINRSASASNM